MLNMIATAPNLLKSRHILVIDDDVDFCQIVSLSFATVGARTFAAYSGQEGLDLLARIKADLIILDIKMPGMDGWEVCQQIRVTSNIPIIMLTTTLQDQNMVQASDTGVDDYLSKPFKQTILMARATALLQPATFQ